MKTIIGMYDNHANLESLMNPLITQGIGIDREHVEVIAHGKTHDHIQNDSSLADRVSTFPRESLHRELTNRGVPRSDAHFFEQGVLQGNSLVLVEVEDDRASQVAEHLRNGTSSPTNGSSASTTGPASSSSSRQASPQKPRSKSQPSKTQQRKPQEASKTMPVIEEELRAERRIAQGEGGVEIERRVEKMPVHEEVRLKEEHVAVKRRNTDRAATREDMMNAFQEGTVEVPERKEELVVSKEPRVVEEIEVQKRVDEKEATIDETLRRVDVDVREMDERSPESMRFDRFRNRYEKHFSEQHAASTSKNNSFDEFEPAYRFGHTHAQREDWRAHEWETISPHLKRDYQARYGQGSWERAKGAVRHAWDTVRAKASSSKNSNHSKH